MRAGRCARVWLLAPVLKERRSPPRIPAVPLAEVLEELAADREER